MILRTTGVFDDVQARRKQQRRRRQQRIRRRLYCHGFASAATTSSTRSFLLKSSSPPCSIVLLFLFLFSSSLPNNHEYRYFPRPLLLHVQAKEKEVSPTDGYANLNEGHRLYQLGSYHAASKHYWRAVLFHSTSKKNSYTVDEAFTPFLRCYAMQGKTVDGFVFVAKESIGRGQVDMGKLYLEKALELDPKHKEAREMMAALGGMTMDDDDDDEYEDDYDDDDDDEYNDKTPEQLYELGTQHFSAKAYEDCAYVFTLSCQRSKGRIGPACSNSIYCRAYILDWGFNGTQFDVDMKMIESLSTLETKRYRSVDESTGKIHWNRATSTHPHMMLGYPVKSMLKRYVAESAAFMDEMAARVDVDGSSGRSRVKDLPSDLPYDPSEDRARYVFANAEANFKIRAGFVGSGFNSKAVLYLSHDMFRFFDTSKFEIHVFSCGPPDEPLFIQYSMRGVDWRERVKSNVDNFHDVRPYKDDHIALARYIHSHEIHILIEWDGYARQGERAQGLFGLRPAPIQILHQEYLGTSGAQYVDYIVTDEVTSPESLEDLYTEKFLYMPNHFFSKGHAMQSEVLPPTFEYTPARRPYVVGTGSPVENRCLSPINVGPAQPSFVYCNFNKFLKNNPQTVRSWIRILRNVPNSILCLLENPSEGVPYLRKFIHETAGTSNNDSDPDSFVEGIDGDELNDRIHFLPWQANPFDHQRRNHDFCSVMLDSYPYNGHTVAQDALYGGVPIVTRSDGDDMCSRVSTSANIVLGLNDLNAYEGPTQYEDIAIKLGNDISYYNSVRKKLIDTCLATNPMHRYWDVPRYVRNFESGLRMAWDRYLSGKPPIHIRVKEDEIAKRGTHEKDLVLMTNRRRKGKRQKKEEKKSDQTKRSGGEEL